MNLMNIDVVCAKECGFIAIHFRLRWNTFNAPKMVLGIIGMVAVVVAMWSVVLSYCLGSVYGESSNDLSQPESPTSSSDNKSTKEENKHEMESTADGCCVSELLLSQWLHLQCLWCKGVSMWSLLDVMTQFNVAVAIACVVFNAMSSFSNSFIFEV